VLSAFTEFPLSTARSDPGALSLGPDRNLWFPYGNSYFGVRGGIGRITPSGSVSQFSLPKAGSHPGALTVGPDGNLWFPVNTPATIGRIDPSALRGTGVVAVKHSGAGITAIVLGFDEVLDPRTARKRSSYRLASGCSQSVLRLLLEGSKDRKDVVPQHHEHGDAQAGQATEGASGGDSTRWVHGG
jgi:streptogramin lyase